MIFYKNFLGIILIIGLILSISPITAYSIETKNNDNCNMNVLTQKTPKETTIGNVNTKLNYTNNSNGSSPSLSSAVRDIYISSDSDRKLYLCGIFLLIMSLITLISPPFTYVNLFVFSLLAIPGFIIVYNFGNIGK